MSETVGFLLLPDFALMSYACATEPLRAANRLSGRPLYAWRHYSPDGAPVAASNGLSIVPDGAAGDDRPLDLLLVCAGGNPAAFRHAPTIAWLRALARRGVRLGGISGGPVVLARAGLLDGRRATLHWEHIPAVREAFPDVSVTGTVYEIDGDRVTGAGGVAALDLMIELISRAHGRALGAAVGDWFLRSELRAGGSAQRMDLRQRTGVRDPRVLAVLARLEEAPEAPLDRATLAALAGVSVRRLEGLFAETVGTSMGRHLLGLRLDRARQLIGQAGLSVTEAATATGFQSASHFARAYRLRFGVNPSRDPG